MFNIKTINEIKKMKKSGFLLSRTHLNLKKIIKPGLNILEIEYFVKKYIEKNGGKACSDRFLWL